MPAVVAGRKSIAGGGGGCGLLEEGGKRFHLVAYWTLITFGMSLGSKSWVR